jgi:type VI secretion system secreted protein Hcp
LTLEIDGNQIEGESTVASMGREGTIECSSFRHGVAIPYDITDGKFTGRKQHEVVRIHKRIDKTTPLLLKALCQNEPVTSAAFRFYRPSLEGTGREEHFYTVLLENGYVTSVRQISEDANLGGERAPPMMEEVTLVCRDITWTYEIGGATHKDSW